jgi:DNA invertase Pin-like site-specific DNA recombinase
VKAAIYTRVSTEEQAERGTSLSTQEKVCRAHVKANGWKLVETFTDAGVSGAKASRPQFDRLMQACRDGKVDVVVVTKLDRFGRSNRHLANALGDLEEIGVRFVSLSEQFDTSTPMGKGMLAISGVFAEIEHATIRERMTAGRRAVTAQGFWGGGCVPFGWRPVAEGAHKRLVVDELNSETIRIAASLLVDDGCSPHEVAERLNALDRPPAKAKRWTTMLLRHMLQREALVPEILDARTFAQMQEALAANGLTRMRKDHVYPLSLRLIGRCGATYRGVYRRDMGVRFYTCKNKTWEERATRCDDQAIRADDIEHVVWEQVCDLLSKPERLVGLAEEYLGLRKHQIEAERDSIEDLDAKIRNLDRAIKDLLVTSAKAGLAKSDIEAAVADLTTERKALVRHREMVESWRSESAREASRMRRLWALAEEAHRRLPNMAPEEQKQILELLDVRVTILKHARKTPGGRVVAPAKVRIEGRVHDHLLLTADGTARDLTEAMPRRGSSRAQAAGAIPRAARAHP